MSPDNYLRDINHVHFYVFGPHPEIPVLALLTMSTKSLDGSLQIKNNYLILIPYCSSISRWRTRPIYCREWDSTLLFSLEVVLIHVVSSLLQNPLYYIPSLSAEGKRSNSSESVLMTNFHASLHPFENCPSYMKVLYTQFNFPYRWRSFILLCRVNFKSTHRLSTFIPKLNYNCSWSKNVHQRILTSFSNKPDSL